MNSTIRVLVVGLLALAALEFGLLGASAAGLVGGSGHALPPIPQRGSLQITPTPVPTETPPGGSSGPASIELLRPSPLAIECNGSDSSTISVVVRDSGGQPVSDGTYVGFAVFNGSPSPYYTQTSGGRASASVVIYSDSYSAVPNVVVNTGDLEAAIRVRCKPNSDCPVSPPSEISPPCSPPPTNTPYPCDPIPGGDDSVSPPCPTPVLPSPPECNPSPEYENASPPCATPTPVDPEILTATAIANETLEASTSTPTPEQDSDVLTATASAKETFEAGTSTETATATPLPNCYPYVFGAPFCNDDTPKHGIGGEIYIGAPEVIEGKIRVPVNTTASPDLFRGFNIGLEFDGSLASIASFNSDAVLGPLFTGEMSCNGTVRVIAPGVTRVVMGCTTQGQESLPTLGPGTLAYISLTPQSTGCLTLHLTRYAAPDYGAVLFGSFTVDFAQLAVQANSIGPDVYVDTSDGGGCVGSCVTFDPGGCGPEATPTPPGIDAMTATASANETFAAMTGTPTPTVVVVPTATPAPSRTSAPNRTATVSAEACADVNGDGRVTWRDVAAVSAHFGRYRAKYDLNNDRHVNLADVKIALRQLGRRC